jgi:pimeloyl-ACP methyl ester carboxylesterase
LLYWHGLNPLGSLALAEAGPAWAARGFRVVGFAAPGIAETPAFPDPDAYRPSRLADGIAQAANELGFETFDFVGWSWGASIGVHLAVRHQQRLRRLVLLDAGHIDLPGDPTLSLDDIAAAMAQQQDGYDFPSPRAAAAAVFGLIQEQPSTEHGALAATGIPVLLIVASSNDSTEEVERFRTAVPQVVVRVVESGHDLFADAPGETVALVGDWLRSSMDTSVA